MIEERWQTKLSNCAGLQNWRLRWGRFSAAVRGSLGCEQKKRCVRLECTAAASQRIASVESQPMVRQPSTSHFWIKLRPAQELELKTINTNTPCIKTAKHVTYITKKSKCVFQKKTDRLWLLDSFTRCDFGICEHGCC